MAIIYGGRSAYLVREHKDAWENILGILIVFSFGIISFLVTLFLLEFEFLPTLLLDIAFFSAFFLAKRVIERNFKKGWSYRKGIKGEDYTARILNYLPDSYIVYRDIKIPGRKWNIDFVVLGPTGIYSIEVKSNDGQFTYNGVHIMRNGEIMDPFIDEVRREYWGLHEYLIKLGINVFVTPVLVLSSNKAFKKYVKPAKHEDIHLITEDQLLRFIKSQNAIVFPINRINEELVKLIPLEDEKLSNKPITN